MSAATEFDLVEKLIDDLVRAPITSASMQLEMADRLDAVAQIYRERAESLRAAADAHRSAFDARVKAAHL